MTNKNLYLDLNVLQTVPSSNINRDDTGAPKTALYGGVTRARVSSQSWKKAMRDYFRDESASVGTRTKEVAEFLAKKVQSLDNSLDEEAAMEKATAILTAAGIKVKKDKKSGKTLTGALLLVSPGQVDKLAQYALNHDKFDDKDIKKEIKQILKEDNSLDLALFGRMVADNPELNVDASAQVAHAISTHEIIPEYDYFTALDDLQSDDANGAAMLGTIEYDSATLYRYANINVKDLAKNLGNQDAIQSIIAFIKAFTLSMPTGKQNTFANKTLPNYIMVTLRPDTPVNLVSAFEEPVVTKGGFVKNSIQKLEDEYQSTNSMLEEPLLNVVLSRDGSGQLEKVTKLSELLDQISAALTKVMQDEDTND
ncbi:type I-E CRISPR-associated protein Cas7/Cse4/CasC [Lactobacillus sp. ESL0731]|uniref:type I-E CRISPR-associated protein Cas7/Cse4/CasC n=1 Tax=unclassified Lactobacillus TaxID=2620435 RepID=UPI0023F91563|nr:MULTISPECIES: type I-E CRISPR-associated protein Cas7/Cse4/CasC [unclassified Lactobacillus]WEV51050.1 type I-E CRISPR-associated protein Cas7/Cse4/CasC [Lactobacillus sp. ESL0700]WEV62180.1 type I-E CRISPR-associated protein Cas7/Cse4/CasC [Lactobacillus sp. ESL0731]